MQRPRRHFMRRTLRVSGSVAPLLLVLAACAAQRPVLYPNSKLEEAGPAASQADIEGR